VFDSWATNNEPSLCYQHNDYQGECAKTHSTESLFGGIKKTTRDLDEEK
jgi:hypothetical protein